MDWNEPGFYDMDPQHQHGWVLFDAPIDDRRDACPPVGAIVVPEGGRRYLIARARPGFNRVLPFAIWLSGLPIGTQLGWSKEQTLDLPRDLEALVAGYDVRPTVGLESLGLAHAYASRGDSQAIRWPPSMPWEGMHWFPAMSICMRECDHAEHPGGCPVPGCPCPNR